MMKNKNTLTITLMSISILLLIVLQVFWLKSSYEKAFYDNRRDVNMLFKSTVLAIRDSLLTKSIEPIQGDSVERIFIRSDVRRDSATFNLGSKKTNNKVNYQEQNSRVQIYVTTRDSIEKSTIAPIVSNIQKLKATRTPRTNRSFIVHLSPDSLDLNAFKEKFTATLSKNNITIPYKVKHLISTPSDDGVHGFSPFSYDNDSPSINSKSNIFKDTIYCDPVRFNPVHRYSASFYNVRASLIKGITPQILFSIFITLLTSTAFIFMYRNIRSQQKLMEVKNDFINNVTHELKTPIATVSVALEALKNFQAMNSQKLTEEYLDIAQRELTRLSMMTDKVLKTAIFESKGVDFIPETVNLTKTVDNVLSSLKLIFEKSNATIKFYRESDNVILKGSSAHLTNVIYNLLDNALKYSQKKPVITITVKDEGEKILLSVKDEGIGIASEFHKKIFEKFFRVPSGDVHNIKGHGLGLSYVRSVVKSHGGEIEVKSSFGKGSEFVIILPKKLNDV